MKKMSTSLLGLFLLALSFSGFSQTNKLFTDGPLWQVSFIHVKPGMGDLYNKSLAEGWVKIMRQSKADGIIMDYKVFGGDASTKEDWNMMLMYQLRNYAALDGLGDKMDAVRSKLLGSDEAQMKGAVNRNELREIFGEKLVQEMNFK